MKIKTGYAKEMFKAIDSVCKLPENEIKTALLKELTIAISHCNKPMILIK